MTEAEILERLSRCSAPGTEGRLSPGSILGDWRLTAFLARGGTAEVYCAEHVVLRVPAAVKVLDAEATEKRRERFAREATILSELKSRAFPRFLAYGEHEGHPYLVEELLEPRDLPASDRDVARYLQTLCRGLAELHARGIVHCDLKPANILFRANGEPVIVDLGLASDRAFGEGCGTPGYSAPEQFTGGAIAPTADIHALGVLANACFGERPPRAWRAIVRRATSSIARERYATVSGLSRAIRWRHIGRNLATVAGICAIFALGLAGLVNWWAARLPETIGLDGRTVVLREPIMLAPGRTLRVVGPGTLDASISGAETSVLWMTNCVVLNRARVIYPKVGLKYELTHGVYLNFTEIKGAPHLPARSSGYILPYDGAFNEVRCQGPETLSALAERKRAEIYGALREEADK